MKFLGGMDNEITNGIIVGELRDNAWHFDMSSSFVIHPPKESEQTATPRASSGRAP